MRRRSLSNECGSTMLSVALKDALASQVRLIAKLEKTSLSN